MLFPRFLVLKILWNNCHHVITWSCLSRNVTVGMALRILEAGLLPENSWIAKMLNNRKMNICL